MKISLETKRIVDKKSSYVKCRVDIEVGNDKTNIHSRSEKIKNQSEDYPTLIKSAERKVIILALHQAAIVSFSMKDNEDDFRQSTKKSTGYSKITRTGGKRTPKQLTAEKRAEKLFNSKEFKTFKHNLEL